MISSSLLNCIHQYPSTPIVIAYSGGIDSQVLLHSVAELKRTHQISQSVSAIHINHGLSPNSAQWQAFTSEQSHQFGIAYRHVDVQVIKQARTSLEAIAREKRYEALEAISPSHAIILTGHHQDDQVETFLLACKRGSGLKGLSAMAGESSFGNKSQLLVRPLLSYSRKEIEQYAKKNNLQWIEDESNSDEHFDRNFIRNSILPQLKERWSGINQTISRSAEHCAQAQNLLEEVAVEDLAKCLVTPYSLSIPYLVTLSDARFSNTIRHFLAELNILMPSSAQLNEIKLQLHAKEDKSPVVQLSTHCLRRFKDALYLTAIFDDIQAWSSDVNVTFLSDGEAINSELITLPDGLGELVLSKHATAKLPANDLLSNASHSHHINNKTIENKILKSKLQNRLCKHQESIWQGSVKPPLAHEVVSIKFSHQNPKCLPEYRNHSKALKKILQELNIAPWQRKRIPFLYYNETLVAVIGHFICKDYIAETKLLNSIEIAKENSTNSLNNSLKIQWFPELF